MQFLKVVLFDAHGQEVIHFRKVVLKDGQITPDYLTYP